MMHSAQPFVCHYPSKDDGEEEGGVSFVIPFDAFCNNVLAAGSALPLVAV